MTRTERGIVFACAACGNVQRLYLPDHSFAEAEMLRGLMVGDSPWYVHPPGADSPIGKTDCCGAAMSGEIFGFPQLREIDASIDEECPTPVSTPIPLPGLPPVDRTAQATTDGRPVDEVRAEQDADGNVLHRSYVVLSDEERARGFAKPVRRSYKHVGRRPDPGHVLRDLTAEERASYGPEFVKFEVYPANRAPALGRGWTADDLASGCGSVTTMGTKLAETYARDPRFYGATMCASCGRHFDVGADGEFVWVDARGVETTERVGT